METRMLTDHEKALLARGQAYSEFVKTAASMPRSSDSELDVTRGTDGARKSVRSRSERFQEALDNFKARARERGARAREFANTKGRQLQYHMRPGGVGRKALIGLGAAGAAGAAGVGAYKFLKKDK